MLHCIGTGNLEKYQADFGEIWTRIAYILRNTKVYLV